MKKFNLSIIATACLVALSLASCSNGKSYAKQLAEERDAANAYLANFTIENNIPADTVFKTVAEYGEAAPYYKLDPDGCVFMQVVYPGTKDNKVKSNQTIYFRYMRIDLLTAFNDGKTDLIALYDKQIDRSLGFTTVDKEALDYVNTNSYGNSNNMSYSPTFFLYGNFTLDTSAQWGSGIQYPLHYLGIDCEVNLLIKSQFGLTTEIANVVPFRYRVRYYASKI